MDATDTPHLKPEHILAHPRFSTGRNAYVDAVTALYEAEPSAIELMRDGGRIMAYGSLLALWGAHREGDLATLPTIGRLKRTIGRFGVASPRQIDLIVARFAQVGHLRIEPAIHDRRLRIVTPTPALLDHDRAFVRAHYALLAELFGKAAYALPLAGDPAFHKAMRGAWIETVETMAREIFLSNPPILRFYAASAGMLMLMKLVRLQDGDPTGRVAIDYTDLGRRFGVSRTHVRTLFNAAAAAGDAEIDARGVLHLRPELIAALDRNIAGRMALLDRARSIASRSLAAAARL